MTDKQTERPHPETEQVRAALEHAEKFLANFTSDRPGVHIAPTSILEKVRAALAAPLPSEGAVADADAAIDIADEIDINNNIGADHRFLNAEAALIQRALRFYASPPSASPSVREAELRDALQIIGDWQNVRIADEHEHSLRDIIRSITDCADRALKGS